MSLAALMDHTATGYRATESTSASGTASKAWAAQESGFACSVQVDSERVADVGPGEFTTGMYRLYAADPTLDIEEGDVIDVTAGPESPLRVEVMQVSRIRNHHLSARCEAWEGSLS